MGVIFGIELSDEGFSAAAMRADGDPAVVVPVGREAWPAVVAWDGEGFVLGREAERSLYLRPRWVSHTFWDNLCLDRADLTGPTRIPACSELAFLFLRAFWENLERQEGVPESVVLALPEHYLPIDESENEKVGLILGMAKDLGIPLSALMPISGAAVADASADADLRRRLIFIDLQLHSSSFTLLETDNEGLYQRKSCGRIPQVGLIPLLNSLTRSMANRFLRATAFDISAHRRLEQTFFEQTRAFFLAATSAQEGHFQIESGGRTHQLTIPRQALRSDLQPFIEGLADAVTKFAHQNSCPPEVTSLLFSSRAVRLEGLAERLARAGFVRATDLTDGAAARGAARLGRDRPPCADLSTTPELDRFASPGFVSSTNREWEAVRLPAPPGVETRLPTHLVIDGIAYRLDRLPGRITGGNGKQGSSLQPFARLGAGSILLHRQAESWSLQVDSPGSPSIPVRSGDKIRLSGDGSNIDLLFAAEAIPSSG